MEDNNNYTYTYRREKKKEQQKLRLIVLIVFCILALICIIAGIISGRKSAEKARENELSASASLAESTSTEEVPTEEPSPYKTGDYTVETGGYSLKFREDHTTDSKVYLEIKDTTKLTIDEIYHDEAVGTSGSGIEYWGKTTYKGYTGWVAMNYLKKAYSDNIVTPDEMTSTEESTTAAPEITTAAPTTTEPTTEKPTEATTAEPTTAATQDTTAAPATDESTTAATSVGGYTPGDYVVNTGDYTLTFRKSASRSGDVIFGIENGVKLTVTKIVETTDAQSDYRYWGEVSYKGQTGYVSMAYLKKAN
jgi:hypothetical protein